jgi:hypothetical protein
MATSFADLKKSRNKDMENLTAQVSKLSSKDGEKKSYADDRFWKPAVDKAGNGFAVIRFLPAPGGEDMPWVQTFSHSFQGPTTGLWYIENSLTTLNKKDPVSEYNTLLWNTGSDADKEVARKQKRKLSYITNIYVVSDPANPDNDGKVFLFKFGKKIFDKLNDLMNPEFPDEQPRNPFDLWNGANFKLKIRKVEGYQNYDKSEFDKDSPVSGDESHMERIWNSEYKLGEFLAESNFKSYDELKTKLNKVLGLDGASAAPSAQTQTREVSRNEQTQEAFKPKSTNKTKTVSQVVQDDDDDEGLSYFEKLAED